MFCDLASQDCKQEENANSDPTFQHQTLQHSIFTERHPSHLLPPHLLAA